MPPRRYSNGGIARELTPERELIGWGHYFEDGNDDYFPGLPQIGVDPCAGQRCLVEIGGAVP